MRYVESGKTFALISGLKKMCCLWCKMVRNLKSKLHCKPSWEIMKPFLILILQNTSFVDNLIFYLCEFITPALLPGYAGLCEDPQGHPDVARIFPGIISGHHLGTPNLFNKNMSRWRPCNIFHWNYFRNLVLPIQLKGHLNNLYLSSGITFILFQGVFICWKFHH